MIVARRLLAVGALLGVAALVTSTGVWGEPGRDKELTAWRKGDGKAIKPETDDHFNDSLNRNRFLDTPVVTYQADKGDTLFALQVLPKLPDATARPKDYLVIVDTSASKALGPLVIAQEITKALIEKLGKDDRLAVWTANLKPKDISRGFKSGKALDDVLASLKKEVPLGAVCLKKCLTEALASFEVKESRQRAVVFLGDGNSVAEPIESRDRAELCEMMVKKQAAFFAVPLGMRLNSQNLHGLISGTGGKAIRHNILGTPTKEAPAGDSEKPLDPVVYGTVKRLLKAVEEPILYHVDFTLPGTVTEALPSKLPPLRRDAGTLVVGKLAAGTKSIDYKLQGTVAGKAVTFDSRLDVPKGDPDHFFLVSIHGQWKAAKDRPALLQSDRALAYAHKQNQLALEDLLAKGEMALEQDKLDAAGKLFDKALQFAPHSARAKGGVSLVEKMKSGKKKRSDMLAELRLNAASREVVRLLPGKRVINVLADGDEKPDAAAAPPERDPLEDVKARRAIAEQQANAVVEEAVRQASRLVRSSPDEAYELLKRTLDGVRANDALTPPVLARLSGRLTREMESVARISAVIKRDQAEALALRAAADARLDIRRTETRAQDRLRERLRVFQNLMDQAREEEAYRQALSMRNDLVSQGLQVPPAVTFGYQTALNGYHLREERELRRFREERFLAVLLEVERSHIPFPDEPPIEFPDAAKIRRMTRGKFDNWGDLSDYRIKKYAVQAFGTESPGRLFELRDKLNKTIDFAGYEDPKTTLIEALDQLAKVYDVAFDVNEKAFKYEMLNDVLKTPIAETNPIPPMRKTTLGTVLKKILSRIGVPSGATYMIRRDQIEITTGQFATAEKAIRVFPVADLVFPIPAAYNKQALQQTASVAGAAGMQGLAAGGGLALGGLGAIGALGGGLGAIGGALGGGGLGLALGGAGLGLALGGAAGLAAGGLAAGAALGAMGQMGVQGNMVGGFNFMGNNNLGAGGLAGFPGGQLGQFGNLGGQFGLQGGTQDRLLITLIKKIVGRPKDWAPQYNPITGQPLNPLDDEKADGGGLAGDNNDVFYFPPANALVAKAPSLMHTQASNLVITGAGAGAGMVNLAPAGGGGRVLVDGRAPVRVDVAGDGGDRKDPKKAGKPLDPREVWENALARSVQEPGLIIACCDFLVKNSKFDHVAEFLKSNLRQGVIVRPWVYKSLAIALRESGGSAEEIERAEVSTADLEPLDSQGYLLAARSQAEDKNYERALAFCKQAATMSPGLPHAFADAARYADMAGDTRAMEWATSHLLRQDWPVGNDDLQRTAVEKLDSLARRLDAAGAKKLRESVTGQRRRDLVIKLVWQGEADLDLKVEEPTGSVCSALTRQTVGGGTLIADSLASMTSETYAAAEAFSGDYKVWVERVWGKALGGKAQLKIIRHQGTPEETEQLVTVKISSSISEPVTVKLEGGRRTEAAYVPPPSLHQPGDDATAPKEGSDAILNRLRALSDPEVTGFEPGTKGGATAGGRPVQRNRSGRAPRLLESDRLLYQNRVQSFVANSVDVTAQAVVSADRRSATVWLKPVFNTVTSDKPVQVVSPIFPGAPSKDP
jgi:hypothetical protein